MANRMRILNPNYHSITIKARNNALDGNVSKHPKPGVILGLSVILGRWMIFMPLGVYTDVGDYTGQTC